jgi:hypothetical protein
MKRYLVILFFLTLSSSVLFATPTHLDIMKPERMDTDLKGEIKSVETKEMYNVSGKFERERQEYDRTGNLITETEWDLEGELYNTLTNSYDETGNFTQQTYIDLDGKYTNDWEIILSPKTHQIAKKNKKTAAAAVSTYSTNGFLVSYRYSGSDKKLKLAKSIKRNENNQLSAYTRLDHRKKPIYTYWFKWKENGFIERERQSYRKEKIERLHVYDYLKTDDHDNWTQRLMVRYDIGGDKKEKVWERLVVRTIEYFEEEGAESTEEELDRDSSMTKTSVTAESSAEDIALQPTETSESGSEGNSDD